MIEAEHSGDSVVLKFSGDIDENVDFSTVSVESAKQLVLDLQEIKLLNSSGLREWILWMKKLNPATAISFRRCPKIAVDQMNILRGFIPRGAIIESFYVPYFCEDCDKEHRHLAVRGRDFMEATADKKEGVLLSDSMKCPKCGANMELDVLPEKYFSFLKYRR